MTKDHSEKPTVPQTLVGISFESTFRAQEFLIAVGGLAAAGMIKIKDAVTIVKDHDGKTRCA